MSDQAEALRLQALPAVRDGVRRPRGVVSYARRGGGARSSSQLWRRCAPRWWIPDSAATAPDLRVDAWFGRSAPLVVEIGSGVGEATVALAAARPQVNLLAVEVWLPGVAQTMQRMEAAGVDNIRLASVDAVSLLGEALPASSVSEIWTFFPDPWPKRRHRKRRLVDAAFARVAATRLVAGGRWRLATDWADYAEQMVAVLDAEPMLTGGVSPRWSERPVTRFEARGLEAGHAIVDLSYRRVG